MVGKHWEHYCFLQFWSVEIHGCQLIIRSQTISFSLSETCPPFAKKLESIRASGEKWRHQLPFSVAYHNFVIQLCLILSLHIAFLVRAWRRSETKKLWFCSSLGHFSLFMSFDGKQWVICMASPHGTDSACCVHCKIICHGDVYPLITKVLFALQGGMSSSWVQHST